MIAFVDQDAIWIRPIGSFDARRVEGSEHGTAPFWSPDGQWLGFGRGRDLVKVPTSGGRPTVITRAQTNFSIVGGTQWSEDDRIFFATGDSAVFEVSANGGEPREYVPIEPPDDDDFHEITLLPDGKSIVCTVHSRTRPWYLAVFDGQHRKELIAFDNHSLMAPTYSPTGHILFHRFGEEDSVWAVPFSTDTLETTGAPFLVSMDDGHPHVNAGGTLAMTRRVVGLYGGDLIALALDRDPQEVLTGLEGQYFDPAYSPDGSAIAIAGFVEGAVDLWVCDLEFGSRTRLTFDDSTNELLPRWSPDGREIAYAQTSGSTFERAGPSDTIHFIAADGSGQTRTPIEGGYPSFNADWSAVAFTRLGEATGRDVWMQTLDGESEPVAILNTPAMEEQPALSPDGRFLAYGSDESGQQKVYLTRFPSGQGKWQVLPDLSIMPVWSSDSSKLYFCGPAINLIEVEVSREGRIMIGQPREVTPGPITGVNPLSGFSISPTDGTVLAIRTKGKDDPPAIGVIENWYEEFRDRAGR
jgi:serine/threonine-protein kinase